MTEERFEEFLQSALKELDPVPPTPREAMWTRIEERRRFEKEHGRKQPVWLKWGVGLAAMLAIGIGLGRLSTREQTPQSAATPSAVAPAIPNRTAYDLAVDKHLTSAEALLTSFKTQPQGTLDPEISAWARDLLTSTRLLLDSPAADNPRVAALLSDLELIIAQIAQLSAPSSLEREIVRDGMNKTAVLPRLRTRQAAGT